MIEFQGYQSSKDNPYHHKLGNYSHFVLREEEAEQHPGKWNEMIFQKVAPIAAEIGIGYGDFMLHFCQQYPNSHFVGMDIRFKRSFGVATHLNNLPNKNFKLLRAAAERLPHIFGVKEIDQLFYFFPDPWPKARHRKRRLFKKDYLVSLHSILKDTGNIYFKTDHDELFQWIIKEVEQSNCWTMKFISHDLYKEINPEIAAPLFSFQTKFEKIFLKQQIKIKAFILEKKFF